MMRTTINQANVATATWWSFAGLVLSIVATVTGAIVGSGPALSVRRLILRHQAKGAHAIRM